MLEKLIGAQIVKVNESSIEVKIDEEVHVLEIDTDYGSCCGYAEFETNLLYSEGDVRNPVITNVELVTKEGVYECDQTIITFYGESKELANIESEAGSGSGWTYGACVTLRCKTLNIDETLAEW